MEPHRPGSLASGRFNVSISHISQRGEEVHTPLSLYELAALVSRSFYTTPSALVGREPTQSLGLSLEWDMDLKWALPLCTKQSQKRHPIQDSTTMDSQFLVMAIAVQPNTNTNSFPHGLVHDNTPNE